MNSFSTPAWVYIPLGLLATAGVALLLWGLLKDRSRGRKRCPQCWYDMSGATGLRCPECGHECRAERELFRTRRRWRTASLGLALLLPLLGFFAYRDGRRVWYSLPPKWSTTSTVRSGTTLAKTYTLRDPTDRGALARVWHNGEQIVELEDWMIEFGLRQYDPTTYQPLAPIGAPEDLNGDGIQELLIVAYSGGAHCCYTVTLLELSTPPRVIATINAVNGMGAEKQESGEILLNIADQSFDYWKAPHAGSPFPSVFYRLKSGRLEIAMERMLRADPDLAPDKLQALATEILATHANNPAELNSDMWRAMLDLMYAGREPEAWSFFDACWPDSRAGKEDFKKEFLDVLNSSVRWRDFSNALAAHRRGDPPAAATPDGG
ncbi:MAG: hypothetical protein ACOYN0_15255 [Phycisphaerales bacterium]